MSGSFYSDPAAAGPRGPFVEHVAPQHVAARLPEKVAAGVMCTGVVVLEGPNEFVLDFVQGVTRPPRLGARVILSHNVMGQFMAAVRDNLARYAAAFGAPKPMPRPINDRRPSIRDLYDEMKIADDLLPGVYATTVMIAHTPAEFYCDFITQFFPTAAVAARVYLAASNLPRMLETMTVSHQQWLARKAATAAPPPPAASPSAPDAPPAQTDSGNPPVSPQPPAPTS